ncbi:type II toxin-antitoxin system Phd/YefM family antitoxin [Lactobacillus sp. Sy-1]|uniref:type II toxin-antitoxin system Phd/YefM family antitoxin n=1 Tax=Lactobacillus sp. Sy-1 TaxID=2109645 RepID=UPI001C5BD3C2|nr:type II toxin-antitoxin system Phd/YefM family antitoxin [Lactobacillus sp. Sy-1]MBW1606324.1 type II toxin-antitoxin system Phd/YefM family antitoxin [Lactobacillus sp. Sy-1]
MEATTYSNFRKQLKMYMDKATENFEPIIVTRKDNKNAVLISETEYNNMLENQYVLGNPDNLKWLEKGKKQVESGQFMRRELSDED